jgi:hypothetical protein
MEISAPDPATAALDYEELFEAVDRQRRRRHLTRAQACAELGVSPASWSCWSNGATIGGESALRISLWCDRDLRDFVKPRAAKPAA